MPTHTLTFHIAVIGPSDTEADAVVVKEVVQDLAEEFAIQGVGLNFHHWSTLPPGFGDSAQRYIDQNISWPDMDFVVGLLWNRFGTPVEGALSGTEHEYRKIYDLFSKSRQPDLLFYFKPPSADSDQNQRDLIAAFKRDVREKALTSAYNSAAELRQTVAKHLRQKISKKLAAHQQVQRRVGQLPPNRRITVEMIIFAEFPSEETFLPVIVLFKNFQGEEFAFDTRTMNPQDLANWIAKSMGFSATPGKTLRGYLDQCNIQNLAQNIPIAQLWLGNILFADHPGLKLKKLNIAIAHNFEKEMIPKILAGEEPYILPLPPSQISNNADGGKNLVL